MTVPDAHLSPRELGARELAGYRVLRSLAGDQYVEVLLGHRSVIAPGGVTDPAETAVQTVAIKVSPVSDAAWDAALRECAALERARGDHVVDLLDLDADDESIRLIFERLPRGDLAELLRIRPRLDAGEAVTVLAPIAVTLLRMHAAGVAHGNLSARTVLFRDDGAPTLIGFSRSELFEAGAPEVVLERVEAVRRDRTAAASLAVTVLERVDGSRARSARELLADIDGCDDELVLPLLASRLFDVAAALPVRFEPDDPEADVAPSNWRPIPVGAIGDMPDPDVVVASPRGLAAVVGRLVPEPLLQGVLDAAGRSPAAPVLASAAAVVGRRWSSWTSGRRRAALAVVAAAATVGIVTAVIPAGAAVTHSTASSGPPTSETSAKSTPAASPSTGDLVGADDRVGADDPLAATAALVSARDRCLSSLSLRCLDGVDEDGSGALKDDQAAIRVAQQGGELPDPLPGAASDGQAVLIERLGDSALVRLGEAPSAPSLLLVKGDGRWRIRDVIAAGATSNAPPSSTGG